MTNNWCCIRRDFGRALFRRWHGRSTRDTASCARATRLVCRSEQHVSKIAHRDHRHRAYRKEMELPAIDHLAGRSTVACQPEPNGSMGILQCGTCGLRCWTHLLATPRIEGRRPSDDTGSAAHSTRPPLLFDQLQRRSRLRPTGPQFDYRFQGLRREGLAQTMKGNRHLEGVGGHGSAFAGPAPHAARLQR